jgi:hypothetical protein
MHACASLLPSHFPFVLTLCPDVEEYPPLVPATDSSSGSSSERQLPFCRRRRARLRLATKNAMITPRINAMTPPMATPTMPPTLYAKLLGVSAAVKEDVHGTHASLTKPIRPMAPD